MMQYRSASRRAEAEGAARAAAHARLIAALALCRGVLRLDFERRESALAARDRITAAMEPCLSLAAGEPALLELAMGAYGAALAALDARILSLNPLVRVQTGESEPVALLAWQLYADTTRMDELAATNGDRTPEFMPTTLLARRPGPVADTRGDVVDP